MLTPASFCTQFDDGDTVVLEEEDESPFMGDIDKGTAVGSVENNLFLAPMFAHTPRPTDFLLIVSAAHSGDTEVGRCLVPTKVFPRTPGFVLPDDVCAALAYCTVFCWFPSGFFQPRTQSRTWHAIPAWVTDLIARPSLSSTSCSYRPPCHLQ